MNSDLESGAAERGVIVAQAAPFAAACRVFAPLYRQLTLTALATGRFGDATGLATAYGDVVAAWEYYLAHDNNGRKVVLIGHSQGASVLKRLIQEHIDGEADVRELVAAAFLLGTSVSAPNGLDVGGDFKNIPACRTASQEGCVISYSTFNEDSPPPILSLFGRGAGLNNQALCVDPGELTGGALTPWITATTFRVSSRTGAAAGLTIDGDYVVYSKLVSSRCVHEGNFTYLSVRLNDDGGAWGLSLPPYITGNIWGLHNLDVSIAVGNLVELVRGYGD
jgi:pimeloyl-ACP methyl ester carboxylesterase